MMPKHTLHLQASTAHEPKLQKKNTREYNILQKFVRAVVYNKNKTRQKLAVIGITAATAHTLQGYVPDFKVAKNVTETSIRQKENLETKMTPSELAELDHALTEALGYGPKEKKDFENIVMTLNEDFSERAMREYAATLARRNISPESMPKSHGLLHAGFQNFITLLGEIYGEPYLYLLSTVKAESNFSDATSYYVDAETKAKKPLARGYYQIIPSFTNYDHLLGDPVASNAVGYDYMLHLLQQFIILCVINEDVPKAQYSPADVTPRLVKALHQLCKTPETLSREDKIFLITHVSAGSNMGVTRLLQANGKFSEETQRHMKKYEKIIDQFQHLKMPTHEETKYPSSGERIALMLRGKE